MGVTKDFIKATIADALTPTFQRPMEDLIYETLDRRQVPTRSDFTELRDLTNNLRGQVSGAIQSLRSLSEQAEQLHDSITTSSGISQEDIHTVIEERIAPLHTQLQQLETSIASLEFSSLQSRIQALEAHVSEQVELFSRIEHLEQQVDALSKEEMSSSTAEGNCLVSDCDQAPQTRGFCTSHYAKFRRGTLNDFINKDGVCKVGKQKYILPIEFEGKAFRIMESNLIVDGQEFALSELKKSK